MASDETIVFDIIGWHVVEVMGIEGGFVVSLAPREAGRAERRQARLILTETALEEEVLSTGFQDLAARIVVAATSASGTLTVQFDSGPPIIASPLPDFEAWELSLPGGRLWVCGPGGEVVNFHPVSRMRRLIERIRG